MRLVAAIVIALSFGLLAAAPCRALSEVQTVGVGAAADAPPQQARRPKVSPRTKVLVRPAYPYRHTHSIYPVPYRFDYPGPNAKRECVAHYVEEHRPSGTVVTPRMRCWWVRG
jgi:hypothetical protein